MTVVVSLDTGQSIRLDRTLSVDEVATTVSNGRVGPLLVGGLIAFQNNETPSRTVYVDPAHVVSVEDDGYSY